MFVTFAKDSDIQMIRLKIFGESFENLSHLQKIRTFKRFDSKFFPESFECFEYPANFTIFAKDSDIRKIQLW